MSRLIFLVLTMGLGLSLMTRSFSGVHEPEANKSTSDLSVTAPSLPHEEAVGSVGETHVSRDGSGQFHLDAMVNGQQLPFLVDTGADKVALTVESARAIGLYVDPQSFEPVAMGAGGPVRGQSVTIDRLEVGGRSLNGVDAVVLEGLGTNLLGQSALAQLGGVELRGDDMVLR